MVVTRLLPRSVYRFGLYSSFFMRSVQPTLEISRLVYRFISSRLQGGNVGTRTKKQRIDVSAHLDFSPVVHDWVNKGLGMSIRVCATGHIKDPMPLIENKSSTQTQLFPLIQSL